VTKREAAIITAYTGVVLGDFDVTCKYFNEIMGRPVFTHELARDDIADEIKEKSRADFMALEVV
jgi:hypothetical protein